MKLIILALSMVLMSFAHAKEDTSVAIHGMVKNLMNGIATIEDGQVSTDVKLEKMKPKDQKTIRQELGTKKVVTLKVPADAIVAQKQK